MIRTKIKTETKTSFIQKAMLIHHNFYNYNHVNYTNNKTKVTITCPIHGDFLQKPYNHLLGKDCIKCGYVRVSNFRLKEQNKILEKMSKVHNNLYCYKESVYKGTHKKIKIKCFIHGFYYQSPANHIKGHGCPKCGLNRTLSHTRSSREEFIKKATKIHGNNYDYNLVEYINSTEKF